MTTSFQFAHITDVHISDRGDSWSTLGAQAVRLLKDTFVCINKIDDLDFVLITGDVLDQATSTELKLFTGALATLQKPWHFVPGNHDGFIDPDHPDAYQPHEAIPLIDPRMSSPIPYAQKAFWSRTVKPGVQLIGLDTRVADDWDGEIDAAQLAWLKDELDSHRENLVIIAVHHPLHNLGVHNTRGWWSKFICRNGAEIEQLLNRYSNVGMVIAGHHHANQIRRREKRLHVCTAALSGYPCTYRVLRMTAEDSKWHTHIETHTAADEATLKCAYSRLLDSRTARRFEPGNSLAWVQFCEGRPGDQFFEG